MPLLNWDKYDEASGGREPLPDGSYLAELTSIEEKTTQNGDEMWRMDFTVQAPKELKGRHIFDNLVFSESAMGRAKLICRRLGLDVKGEMQLVPSMIKGHRAFITVTTEEYQAKDGTMRKRNAVPFAGYERADGIGVPAAAPVNVDTGDGDGTSEETLPF